MSQDQSIEFSKWRAALWPIRGDELKKFIPLALMMFCILFNYTTVRILKDSLVIADKQSGSEVVNFLKFWVVMPASILFVIAFAKLSNILSRQGLFFACLMPFILFFGVFGFLVYPNQELLHPSIETIIALQANYPNLKWVFPIYGLWTFSAFYTFAELWGNIGINILFWQFANEVTRTSEAKRFYSLFGLFGNLGLIAAGQLGKYLSVAAENMPEGVDSFQVTLQTQGLAVVASGIVLGTVYIWMNRYILTDPRYYEAADLPKGKKKKPKLSISESLKAIVSSRYLGFIALLTLGYGISVNIVEVTWKNQVKEMCCSNRNMFSGFMSDLYSYVGIITMVLLYSTKGVVRRFGWLTGALATPLMILVTGILFYTFILFEHKLLGIVVLLGTTPLILAVWVGSIQNIFSKGIKYALFDPTREMAYIPLDQEMKVKGKAAVDVIGGRLGKSGGGLIQQFLLILTGGTQLTIAPYLAGIVGIVVGAWIWAVRKLSVEYNALVLQRQEEAEAADKT